MSKLRIIKVNFIACGYIAKGFICLQETKYKLSFAEKMLEVCEKTYCSQWIISSFYDSLKAITLQSISGEKHVSSICNNCKRQDRKQLCCSFKTVFLIYSRRNGKGKDNQPFTCLLKINLIAGKENSFCNSRL